MAKHKASIVRIYATEFRLSPERDPLAEEREDLSCEITSSPAYRKIVDYLAHARDLGFDPADPDLIRRAIQAGTAAHEEDCRRKEHELSLQALAEHDDASPNHPPVIYYMRMGDFIKIGTTVWLARRLREINPQGVMAVEPGGQQEEKQRHREFANLRTHSEWFRLDARLAEHISALRHRFEDQMGQSLEAWLERQQRPGAVRYRSQVAKFAVDSPLEASEQSDPSLIPAAQAARMVGVSPQLFNFWRRTGRIAPAAITPKGRKLYRVTDVLAVPRWRASA